MTDNDLELRAAVSNENEKLQAENAKLNERLDMTGRANFQLRSENAKLQEQLEEWVGKTAEKAKACCDLREERDQLRENLHKQISYAVSVEVMRDQLHERLTRLEGLCRDYAGQYSESESCVVAPGRAICAEVKSWASEPAKEPELAACPWCQGSDIIINDNGPVRERTAPDSFWCECVSCHCEGPIAQGEFARLPATGQLPSYWDLPCC